MDWHVRLGDNDVGACCAVVTTSEYCTGVVAALAANVAKLLDPPLGEQVLAHTSLAWSLPPIPPSFLLSSGAVPRGNAASGGLLCTWMFGQTACLLLEGMVRKHLQILPAS